MDMMIRTKLYVHSSDGKSADLIRRTQKGFEKGNRRILEMAYSMPKDKMFFKLDAKTGETDVDGEELFVYERDEDEQDARLGKAISFALRDLLNQDSSLYQGLYTRFLSGNEDSRENFVEFAMKIIDAILADEGSGAGGGDLGEMTKLVAKVYAPYSNRYLDYSDYLNYFSFYLNPEVWEEEIDALEPEKGDFMLDVTIDDLDDEIILKHVVPALYYSLNFVKDPDERVRNYSLYELELG